MIVECHAFRAVPLSSGLIRLEVEQPTLKPEHERMSLDETAILLGGMNKRSVVRLSNRTLDPLPLVRGKGRPHALRSAVEAWLSNNTTNTPAASTKRRQPRNRVAEMYNR